jgi:hypothetical protein
MAGIAKESDVIMKIYNINGKTSRMLDLENCPFFCKARTSGILGW